MIPRARQMCQATLFRDPALIAPFLVFALPGEGRLLTGMQPPVQIFYLADRPTVLA